MCVRSFSLFSKEPRWCFFWRARAWHPSQVEQGGECVIWCSMVLALRRSSINLLVITTSSSSGGSFLAGIEVPPLQGAEGPRATEVFTSFFKAAFFTSAGVGIRSLAEESISRGSSVSVSSLSWSWPLRKYWILMLFESGGSYDRNKCIVSLLWTFSSQTICVSCISHITRLRRSL